MAVEAPGTGAGDDLRTRRAARLAELSRAVTVARVAVAIAAAVAFGAGVVFVRRTERDIFGDTVRPDLATGIALICAALATAALCYLLSALAAAWLARELVDAAPDVD